MPNYVIFDDITTQLELIEPNNFYVVIDYAYQPETAMVNQDTTPVSEYHMSILVRDIDTFQAIRTKLHTQRDSFINSEEVNRINLQVVSDKALGEYDGTYQVFWVLEPGWYERLGSQQFLVNLHGWGEPSATSGSVKPNQSFSVSEDAAVGTVIGTVQGYSSGVVLEGRPDVPFAYDDATGTLSVNGVLDYETRDEYVISIGTTDVVVYILDAVDNPIPDQPAYTFYVSPTAAPGTGLGNIAVTQSGESGIRPSFSITSGNANNNFAIDAFTGDLIILSMDGVSDGHVVTVNYGVAEESITCTIRLLTEEGGLNLPDIRYSLPPYPNTGVVIGTFPNAALSYSVSAYEVAMQANQLVVVDGKTAFTEGVLQYSISAIDPTTLNQGEFTVYVDVYDPAKLTDRQEFWISVDSTNGSVVGQVEFPGVDSNSVSLEYSLDTSGTPFSINSRTGELLITQASTLVVNPAGYNLTISANSQAYTRTVTVVVYDVTSSSDTTFTVAETAGTGVVVGNLGSALTYPVTVSGGSLGVFSLDLTTGVITVASTPITPTNFEVTDAGGNTLSVAITLDSGTTTDSDFLGDVYTGQSGQAVATLSNIRYTLGSVGFGQGGLQVSPDTQNSGGYTRTIADTIVINSSDKTKSRLSISTDVSPTMAATLRGYWESDSSTQHLVSVPGLDWSAYMVGFNITYGETVSVQITLVV